MIDDGINEDQSQSHEFKEVEVDHNVQKSTEFVKYTSELISNTSFFEIASNHVVFFMIDCRRGSDLNFKHIFF